MTSRRSAQGWWTRRAEQRQALQLVPTAPRLVGPMPFYPLPTPRLLPAPTLRSNRKVEQTRMDKFTSVEKRMLQRIDKRMEINRHAGDYGYVLKLVKRGYFEAVENQDKRLARFTITPAGERARAGMALLKSVQEKQALTSYNSMRAATA
jgi:hypothetical protein